jgi:tetratricopeptide (TPR) repeat protein
MNSEKLNKYRPYFLGFNLIFLIFAIHNLIVYYSNSQTVYPIDFIWFITLSVNITLLVIQTSILLAFLYIHRKKVFVKEIKDYLRLLLIINALAITLNLTAGNLGKNPVFDNQNSDEAKKEMILSQIDTINRQLDTSQNIDLLYHRALLYRVIKEYSLSNKDLIEIAEADSGNFKIYCEIAWNMMALPNYQGALDYYKKAIEIDSTDEYVNEQIEWLEEKVSE